jgi:anti-sigma-K factor RskA
MTDRHANPEDLELYALGALEGEEKLTLKAHLNTCAECRGQVAAAQQSASLLGLAVDPVAPAASVKQALMARVHAEARPAPPQKVLVPVRKKRWGLRFSLGFAMATVILALATTWLWKENQRHRQEAARLRTQLDGARADAAREAEDLRAVAEVVSAPDTVAVTLQQQAGGPPGQAHVLYNARQGLVIYSGQMPPTPDGKSYQLWLVPTQGAPVSAGLVEPNQQNGTVLVRLPQGLAAKAFAVTVEPQGGRPQPTGPMVLVGALSS